MRMMMVMRQLSAVLDQRLAEVTRTEGITPQDALVLTWMEQVPGISGSNIADLVGRKRQNVQASLLRLKRLGFALKYPASYRDRTVGWGLTEQGHQLSARVAEGFRLQEEHLKSLGVSPGLLHDLEVLIRRLRTHPSPFGSPGLIEIPKEPKVPLWDV